jgi:hypothetical protein
MAAASADFVRADRFASASAFRHAARYSRSVGSKLKARSGRSALMFGHDGENVDRELVRKRHIGADKLEIPQAETKFTFLASRSSFAITSLALCFLQAVGTAASWGQSRLPLSISTKMLAVLC